MRGEVSTIRPIVPTPRGNAEWFAQSVEYYADNPDEHRDRAQSGTIGAGQETWMQTTVVGPGNVSFYYKMSSVSGDALAFYVDEDFKASWSQGSSWPWTGNFAVPSGTHTLKWKYYKYSGSTAGSAWVDAIQWSGGVPGAGGGADWEQITYTYDPSGRRIAKDVDGVVTKYVYDGDHCIAEYDGSNNLLRKYIHGPCIDEPICMVEAAGGYAGTYYYHFDALGSVVALSDASGDTVQVYEYDVYGQVAASDPNHPNRFLFTGREFDTETGLYYYRARYYNPTIGRFLQTDPIGYGDGLNWYAYCGNTPTELTDPYGLKPEFRGYTVERAEGGGIKTTLTWYDPEYPDLGERKETYYNNTWEEWVYMMASDVFYSKLLVDPAGGNCGVGWGLISVFGDSDASSRRAFWSVRAMVHLGTLSEDTITSLVKEHTHIQARTWMWLREMKYGGDNTIQWAFWAIPTIVDAEEYGEWVWAASPIALLAHELEHARLTKVDPPNIPPGWMRRYQEASAIAVQNATMSAIHSWNPDYYDQLWAGIDWIRDNPDAELL